MDPVISGFMQSTGFFLLIVLMHNITKIAYYLVIIFIIISINFLLPRMMPGDPLSYLTDPSVDMVCISEEDRDLMLAYYGLDKPLSEQYIIYADNCLLSDNFMRDKNIIFKKIPRDITKL